MKGHYFLIALVSAALLLTFALPAEAQLVPRRPGETTTNGLRPFELPANIKDRLPPALQIPADLQLIDCPNDAGKALLLVFSIADPPLDLSAGYDVMVDGEWVVGAAPALLAELPTVGSMPQCFGYSPANPDDYVLRVDRFQLPPVADQEGESASADLVSGTDYQVRLVLQQGTGTPATSQPLSGRTSEQYFNSATLNNLITSMLFAGLILFFIFRARKNPNLFIRRIKGLEAVDEAIGRATEMGKPILFINGLDPLSTLSTVAAVNILGRVSRMVANYDTDLLVPCFDPVVMTVAQETVRNAYMEAGRPDAYRADSVFFLTDQQFSYTASTCGIMLREKPAANFLLGYFYAEALLLAETGYTTGAIQIAGTDALAQLPFFITTCDYTLIGEELYAASAYLSREPMLLGSLKGQDMAKAFVMGIIILGTILASFGIDTLTHMLEPLI